MAQIKTGTIDLEDGRMYYEVAGEGEPLVLLHAVFDSRMWDDQWDELSQQYGIVQPPCRPTTILQGPELGVVFRMGGTANDCVFARAYTWTHVLNLFELQRRK